MIFHIYLLGRGQKRSMQIENKIWVSLQIYLYLGGLYQAIFLKLVVFQEMQTVLNKMMHDKVLIQYQKYSIIFIFICAINFVNLYCDCYIVVLKRQ